MNAAIVSGFSPNPQKNKQDTVGSGLLTPTLPKAGINELITAIRGEEIETLGEGKKKDVPTSEKLRDEIIPEY